MSAPDAPDARLRDRLRSPVVQLNLAGIVLVGVALIPTRAGDAAGPPLALGAPALAAWLVWTLRGPGRARGAAIVVGVLVAAVGAGLGAPSLIAPAIAGLIVAISDTTRSAGTLAVLVGAAAIAVTVAAVAHRESLDDVLSLLAGLAIGTLGGTTRRQRKRVSDREREVLASTLAAEREATRAQLLEARSTAARDVHDVLAHSLGGLVLQLDAIEALLEHGRTDEAAVRAAAARRLAGEGLTEARRAVAALRDPDAAAAAVPVPDDALSLLLAEHRALGAPAELSGDPSLRGVDPAHREALAAALREALVNARRHEPGALVQVTATREPQAMVLRVENPLGAAAPAGAVGHGLIGMRERFAALGDGSTAAAGRQGDRFVVSACVVLP